MSFLTIVRVFGFDFYPPNNFLYSGEVLSR